MKYTILIALAILLGVNNSSSYAQEFTREGNTFSSIQQNRRSSTPPIETKFMYKDTDGKQYPIYCSPSTGSCFIVKTSKKTGKPYRKYLGAEISKQVCQEIGIEYKPKNK